MQFPAHLPPRVLGVVALVFSSATLAQTRQAWEPVVITASRIEQPLVDALPSVSVITRDEIERAAAPDLLTLLARLPGVEIAQLGGIGSQAGVFLRGGESRHTLVLIDGVPMNNANFSLAALDQVMVAQIERVEIVRGNVSSLYGSQAVGGVIQIFTRGAGADSGLGARASVGSRGTQSAQAAVAGASAGWRYAVALSGFDTDGFNAIDQGKRPGTNPDRDGYTNRSAAAQVSYEWAGDNSVGARAFRSRATLQYDSEFGPATQADESVQTIESVSFFARGRLAPNWTSSLAVGRLRDALDAGVTAYPYFVASTNTQLVWGNEITVADGWRATLGAERLRQEIDSDTTYTVSARTVNTLRAGLLGDVAAHQLQLNVRRDAYSDFGAASTVYAGYGYVLNKAWKFVVSASTAFNAPTFNDLFYPYGGNLALTPERTRASEAGVQFRNGPTLARLQLFRARYRDLIGFDAAFNRVNIGRASADGAELSVETSVSGWHAAAALTAQDARNDLTGMRLARRAREFANLQLTRSVGGIDLQANLKLTGARVDRAGGAEHELAGYSLFDVAMRWRAQRSVLLMLRVENVFNRSYENAFGYRGTPRGVFAGLEARM